MLYKFIVASAALGLVSLEQANAAECSSKAAPADKIVQECGCATADGTDGSVDQYCIGTTPLDVCSTGVVLQAECACPSAGGEVGTNVGYASGKVCTASGDTTNGGTFSDAVTGKCTGNTGGTGDVDCTNGDGTTATNTQNKGSSVDGTTPAACCEAPTVTGKCTGNTDASTDVDCTNGDGTTATNTQNKGSSVDGTTPAACCEAPTASAPAPATTAPAPATTAPAPATTAPAPATTTPSSADDHADHDHSPSPALIDAASTISQASMVTALAMTIAYMLH